MRMSLRAKLDISEEEWDVILKECGVLKSNKNWNKNCEGPGGVFNEICIHQARLYNELNLGVRQYNTLADRPNLTTRWNHKDSRNF